MSKEIIESNLANIVEEATTSMQNAQTPEEAYKLFMANAGRGMLQVVADSLALVVANSVSSLSSNPNIQGWENFVDGCCCTFDYGSPYTFTMVNPANENISASVMQFNKLQATVTPKVPKVLGGSVSISVGGSWSF